MTDITFNIINGTPDYTVVINGGEYIYVYETSGHKTISLPSGDYILVVTDSMNCVAQTEFNIPEITTSTTTSTSSTTTTTSTSTSTTTTSSTSTTTTTTTSPIVCNLNYTIDSVEEETTTTTSTTQAITPVEYGALYNWWAATDVRNIAPVGFHVPTYDEYQTLLFIIEPTSSWGSNAVGAKLKETGTTHWQAPNTGATNEVGFNARGTGSRNESGGFTSSIKQTSNLWTTTEAPGSTYWNPLIRYNDSQFVSVGGSAKVGNPIRFIADSGTPTQAIGNDGKVYPCVTIGGQTWTAANSNETKYRNGDWITGFDGGVYTPIADAAWAALTTEAMCYYDNDELNG